MAQHRRDWLAGGDRRAAAVARIEAAATALFLERGIDDVGVDEVAARAGCSRATLYRHVGGKAALVDAVLTRSAATVGERVAAAVAPHTGARRVVEAILASVAAIRADPVLSRWLATRSAAGDGYLTASPVLSRIAASLTRTTDDEAAQWVVRVVLSLLSWPLPDAAAERRLVQRFVAPGYAARP
ncbi:helix-turn-helix transcriptional regulator [Nocardia cyriacigeorgica]|uniref:Transcriptional regulator, TetR family n=2 Tax=Nocardia cyriacigeorgica TaxID=135487 RepID=H6RCL6_NOCCG|nr:TetR/AcrR family transcriptional regulator [Nocardia cyriacigeorgica]MBF6288330.1 helix-turn-helix transcriptional regulator [Nocardia cyriacigeorgica]MBF6424426.1 helix-turn-helix transcriptional regulator [Nocardia cyriacigeorgica]NEW31609.1 helix-turn-helix transcriptional regulator [Nocardia cyriacigeorgica]CCF65159.1 Transcriptional regulator, TetR family [Nocardia cyriacigeorgica GUH-2]BDT88807.1 transcriptional regulator [Nocardia cyriacigeorgica]